MTRRMQHALCAALITIGSATVAMAQAPPDSLYRRAQRLANEGSAAAARELMDSLVRVSADGSEARAEALFWRGTIAPDSQSALGDYLTIVVDHALSPRAADALLRLGRYEFEHSDRETALRHLERLVLEYGTAPAATDGWYWLGRARMQDNDLAGGCAALDSALSRLPEGAVERLRPVQFYSQPCKNLVVAPPPVAPKDSGTTAAPKRDSVKAPRGDSTPAHPAGATTSKRDSAPAKPKYSVQIAAYDSRSGADALAKRLTARGYEARVDSLKLFHVRIGMYAARSDAVALVNKLKQQGQAAIVVEVERREP